MAAAAAARRARVKADALDKVCAIMDISMTNRRSGPVDKELRFKRTAAMMVAEVMTSLSSVPVDTAEYDKLLRKHLAEIVLRADFKDAPASSWEFLRELDDGELDNRVDVDPDASTTGSSSSPEPDEAAADAACVQKYGFCHPAFSALSRSWLHVY